MQTVALLQNNVTDLTKAIILQTQLIGSIQSDGNSDVLWIVFY